MIDLDTISRNTVWISATTVQMSAEEAAWMFVQVKDLQAEIVQLRLDLAAAQRVAEGLAERVAAQSDLLSKRAERPG